MVSAGPSSRRQKSLSRAVVPGNHRKRRPKSRRSPESAPRDTLPRVFPVLFEPFGFAISSFGVMVALGFVIGGVLMARSFELAGLERETGWNLLTWCAVGGLLGAKLWYVAEQVVRHPDVPATAFLLSRGGLTWYGGFLGGMLLGAFALRRYRVPLGTGLDVAAPALAIGQAIGRIGCFLVGDDYGARTTQAWGVEFPRGLPPTVDPLTGEVFAVHPTMLYESAWLFLLTAWLWRRRGRSPFLFGEYLIAQGLGRLVIEHWRVNPALLGPLTNAQLVAVALLVAGVAAWVQLRRRGGGATRAASA